jgi:2-amino-4-hydroxy-6-hydroxymethyldihydropteridine diphosphokinase
VREGAESPARRARIGLGSNEDAARNLARARRALEAEFRVVACTAQRETPASDGGSDRYHNQIVDVETALPRAELVARLKQIEAALGRVRSPGARVVIDLDLLVLAGEYEAPELHAAPHWRLLVAEPGRDA